MAQPRNVFMVMPLLVAPPGSSGSSTKPPSCLSSVGKKSSNFAMRSPVRLSRLAGRALQLLAARLRQVGAHTGSDERRERAVACGVRLVPGLGGAVPEPGLLRGAQLRAALLVELRAQLIVSRIHCRLRALQAIVLAFAHRRGALRGFAFARLGLRVRRRQKTAQRNGKNEAQSGLIWRRP